VLYVLIKLDKGVMVKMKTVVRLRDFLQTYPQGMQEKVRL